jgi:hypothetical protein
MMGSGKRERRRKTHEGILDLAKEKTGRRLKNKAHLRKCRPIKNEHTALCKLRSSDYCAR